MSAISAGAFATAPATDFLPLWLPRLGTFGPFRWPFFSLPLEPSECVLARLVNAFQLWGVFESNGFQETSSRDPEEGQGQVGADDEVGD